VRAMISMIVRTFFYVVYFPKCGIFFPCKDQLGLAGADRLPQDEAQKIRIFLGPINWL